MILIHKLHHEHDPGGTIPSCSKTTADMNGPVHKPVENLGAADLCPLHGRGRVREAEGAEEGAEGFPASAAIPSRKYGFELRLYLFRTETISIGIGFRC